jgi:hypothetical protein
MVDEGIKTTILRQVARFDTGIARSRGNEAFADGDERHSKQHAKEPDY